MFSNMSAVEKRDLAIKTKSKKKLMILSTDRDVSVRWSVAGNPSTPKEVLTTLSTDQDKAVRGWAKKTQKKQLSKHKKNYCENCLST